MSRRAVIDFLAMKALRGMMVALPEDIGADDVLKEFWNIGGVKLPDTPKDIVKMALRYSDEGARISHIIVNTVGSDVHIGLLVDTPEHPATEKAILDRYGFLTYVYVPTAPDLSELGYCYFERKRDRSIHRVG